MRSANGTWGQGPGLLRWRELLPGGGRGTSKADEGLSSHIAQEAGVEAGEHSCYGAVFPGGVSTRVKYSQKAGKIEKLPRSHSHVERGTFLCVYNI